MNIEAIEEGLKVCVEATGGRLRPTIPEAYRPENSIITNALPPILQPRRILVDSARVHTSIFPWPQVTSERFTDDEFLALPHFAPGHSLLQGAIQHGLSEVVRGKITDYGGTRRRLDRRPSRIIAGPEGTLPLFLLAAPSLLTQPPSDASVVPEPEEVTARQVAENIIMNALNYDRRIPCDESQLDQVVPAVGRALERALRKAGVAHQVDWGDDMVTIHVPDAFGVPVIYAPPTIEGLVFPRRGTRNPHESVSLYPDGEIAEGRISITQERPVGNPRVRPIVIRTGVVDGDGRWLDISGSQFISRMGIPDDHRTGLVNDYQNRGMIPGRAGWYRRAYHAGDETDSIPEHFPADGDRAYCTLFRMLAELLDKVYVAEFIREPSAMPVEPLAEAIRTSTDRLIHIITDSGSIGRHKVEEAFQQIIIANLNQPHAFASLAHVIGLGPIFPRAEPLWHAMTRRPLVGDEGEPCTDGFLSATVRMPEIWVDRSAATYKLGEPTAIDRVMDYAQRVAGIPIPECLSPLAKLAWLYTPFAQA